MIESRILKFTGKSKRLDTPSLAQRKRAPGDTDRVLQAFPQLFYQKFQASWSCVSEARLSVWNKYSEKRRKYCPRELFLLPHSKSLGWITKSCYARHKHEHVLKNGWDIDKLPFKFLEAEWFREAQICLWICIFWLVAMKMFLYIYFIFEQGFPCKDYLNV